MAEKMPIARFVEGLRAALERKDGYILGAKGQNPKKWKTTSWWFTQYKGDQKKKALYWRENAARVWDCNGMAEGLYEEFSGANINTKARDNYAAWCDPKGKGDIPAQHRVPGAAVFKANDGGIHHVGYLDAPVDADNPAGDWHVIEAKGVMQGVVRTKLSAGGWNRWGMMTKYFDYGENISAAAPHLGDRLLKNGCDGEDVRELQSALIRLGYDCGKWGADGDFGDATEMAVEEFQRACGLTVDGKFGEKSLAALEYALAMLDQPPEEAPESVRIEGGNCWVRSAPDTSGQRLGVAERGKAYPFGGEISETGWLLIEYNGQNGWVSGKYGRTEG